MLSPIARPVRNRQAPDKPSKVESGRVRPSQAEPGAPHAAQRFDAGAGRDSSRDLHARRRDRSSPSRYDPLAARGAPPNAIPFGDAEPWAVRTRSMPSSSLHGSANPTPNATAEPVIVGDVHGCGEELRELLHDVDRGVGAAWIVFIGDLFTKGPAPHLVVEEILDRRLRGQRVTLLCGNHDQRMLLAFVQVEAGLDPDRLPRTERETWQILHKRKRIRAATELLVECNETISIGESVGPRSWTAVHGGIEPRLGLARTPDQLKIHIKAESEDDEHWWERYRGDDGLIVVGHKPLRAPMLLRRRDGTPIVVNVDTGCVYGNTLTAYLPHSERFIAVPSRQHRGDKYRSLREVDASGSTRRIARRV